MISIYKLALGAIAVVGVGGVAFHNFAWLENFIDPDPLKNTVVVIVDPKSSPEYLNRTYRTADCKYSLLKESFLYLVKTDPTALAQTHIRNNDRSLFARATPESGKFTIWGLSCSATASQQLQSGAKKMMSDSLIRRDQLRIMKHADSDIGIALNPGEICHHLHSTLSTAFYTLYNIEKMRSMDVETQQQCQISTRPESEARYRAQWQHPGAGPVAR